MFISYLDHQDPKRLKLLEMMREALLSLDPQIRTMIEEHRRLSVRWTAHEILPWGKGEDFAEKPWTQEQSWIKPEIALALETHLLTEDNLPYYHHEIAKVVSKESALFEWNGLWTAEEAGHSIVLRDYILLTRAMDPKQLEQDRVEFMQRGFHRHFGNPFEVFAYTSIQELATRLSHLKLGQKSEEPVLAKLMTLVSKDENYHFIFYRGLVKKILEIAPNEMLVAIANQFYTFEMPGSAMEGFDYRMDSIARLGIYGAKEHRDFVIKPVLQYWGIEKMQNLSDEGRKAQDKIMRLTKILDRLVQRQEAQNKKAEVATDYSVYSSASLSD